MKKLIFLILLTLSACSKPQAWENYNCYTVTLPEYDIKDTIIANYNYVGKSAIYFYYNHEDVAIYTTATPIIIRELGAPVPITFPYTRKSRR